MSFQIMPQEVQRSDNSNDLIVKTKVPRDAIDARASILIQHIRRHRLSAGDHVRVMCMSHDYGELFNVMNFVVTLARTETKRVVVNDQETTSTETMYRLALLAEWCVPGAGVVQAEPSPSPAPAAPPPSKTKVAA